MAAGHPDYDTFLSSTLNNYRSTLVDNVFSANPLFLKLKERVRYEDGGDKISVPLMYGQNSTVKTYDAWERLDLTPQEGITTALFDWGQIAGSIGINGIEEFKNSGKSRIFNLLKARTKQTEMSLTEAFGEMSFLAGTDPERDWLGLDALIGDENSTVTTVGGIDCTDSANDWWRSVVVDVDALASQVRSDAVWTNVYNTASKGSDKPDIIVTTQDLFEHYEANLATDIRYTSTDSADARFNHVLFKKVPVFYDDYCQSGRTYFINSSHLELVGAKGTWFRQTPFETVPDVDGKWANILTYGGMVIDNRRRQGLVRDQDIA
jgi:hypothetical protein